MKAELPDFVALKMRYDNESFPTGARAELRRVAEPDDVAFTPALYRLFPGQRPDERHLRLAYLELPSVFRLPSGGFHATRFSAC